MWSLIPGQARQTPQKFSAIKTLELTPVTAYATIRKQQDVPGASLDDTYQANQPTKNSTSQPMLLPTSLLLAHCLAIAYPSGRSSPRACSSSGPNCEEALAKRKNRSIHCSCGPRGFLFEPKPAALKPQHPKVSLVPILGIGKTEKNT